ncbi:MAG: hypothetical protein KC645_06215, partial [Gemmatimonadetes bacterium]|nr:hypothetical protein [Gemmatimonadota bacterium]
MIDRRGVALVPLLLLMAGMLVCAGAVVSLGVAARAGVAVERERVQVRLAAEAGLRGLGLGAAELALLPGPAVGHGVGTLPGGVT